MEGVDRSFLWLLPYRFPQLEWMKQPFVLTLVLSVAAHLVWLQPVNTPAMQLLSSASAASLPVSIAFAAAPKPERRSEDDAVEPAPNKPAPSKPALKETLPALESVLKTDTSEPQVAVQEKPVVEDSVRESQTLEKPIEQMAEATTEQMQVATIDSEAPTLVDDSLLPVIDEPSFSAQPQPPVYPKLALKRRWQGQALVQALVNELGETERVELVESTGYRLLDQSALKAVSGWSFAAAQENGIKTRAWVQVPVNFAIR